MTLSVSSALLSPEWELVKSPAPAAVPEPVKTAKPAAKPAEKKPAATTTKKTAAKKRG